MRFSVPQLQGKVPMYQKLGCRGDAADCRTAVRDVRLEHATRSVRQALLDDSTFLWVGAVDDMKTSANRASAPNEENGHMYLVQLVFLFCAILACVRKGPMLISH